jgi:hypothetical protein
MHTVIDEPPLVREARLAMRRFQKEMGHRIDPDHAEQFGILWREALRKDPEGSQLMPLINDFRERLTPMRS